MLIYKLIRLQGYENQQSWNATLQTCNYTMDLQYQNIETKLLITTSRKINVICEDKVIEFAILNISFMMCSIIKLHKEMKKLNLYILSHIAKLVFLNTST